jgi:predicted Zn-ribbon and HTH transcriptional regulator
MGQSEIIEVLQKSGKPLTANEIAKALDETIQKVLKNMKRLIKYKEVICIEIDKDKSYEKFNSKHKMKLYYYL